MGGGGELAALVRGREWVMDGGLWVEVQALAQVQTQTQVWTVLSCAELCCAVLRRTAPYCTVPSRNNRTR